MQLMGMVMIFVSMLSVRQWWLDGLIMLSVIGMENIMVGFIIDLSINFEYSYVVILLLVSFLVRKNLFILQVSSVFVNMDGFVFSILYIGIIIGFSICVSIGVSVVILIIVSFSVFIVIKFFLNWLLVFLIFLLNLLRKCVDLLNCDRILFMVVISIKNIMMYMMILLIFIVFIFCYF